MKTKRNKWWIWINRTFSYPIQKASTNSMQWSRKKLHSMFQGIKIGENSDYKYYYFDEVFADVGLQKVNA